MITQFEKIDKIGSYVGLQYDAAHLKPFSKLNILYGANGSGKTTLSNILFLMSKHCKDRENLKIDLIEEGSDLIITTATGKVTPKNIVDKELDLYVFNSKFIRDHVYDGSQANIASFSDDVKLTSPEIEIINQTLVWLTSKRDKINSWQAKIQKKLDEIFKVLSDEFQSKVSDSRLVGIKPLSSEKHIGNVVELKRQLQVLYKNYELSKNLSGSIEKYASLLATVNSILDFQIDPIKINSLLLTAVTIDAKDKLKSRIQLFRQKIEDKKLESIGDLEDWFRKSGRLLIVSKEIEKHCPLCDTDLGESIQGIIDEFTGYFSNALIELYKSLDNTALMLRPFTANNHLDTNQQLIDGLISQCNAEFNFTIQAFDFPKQDMPNLVDALKCLEEAIKKKKQHPDRDMSLKPSETDSISKYIFAIQQFKETALVSINSELETRRGKNVEGIVKEIKAQIKLITSVELNEKDKLIFDSKNKTNSDISQRCIELLEVLEGKIAVQEGKKTIEISKLNNEAKYINIYLKHFGIDNFVIDRDKDKTSQNLVIIYSTGKRKTKLSHSLSDGEKTALAFAYFISKLRVEKIEGSTGGLKDCIIVIDDPISSLDDNRLFQTANLIDSFMFYNMKRKEEDSAEADELNHHPCQLFVFSHNLTFVKYLHNALRSNEKLQGEINEYYLSSMTPRIRNLPSGLKNFTNTYIHKLTEIIAYKETGHDYDTVKNYLPNYIRIVLETFLSFKLALVKDKGDRLPGLGHLISAMVREFSFIDDIKIGDLDKDGAIKRLTHLKKIADHESHGTIYRAEEFSFISEAELSEFAKYTVQVIEFIDNLHFKKIKAHVVK